MKSDEYVPPANGVAFSRAEVLPSSRQSYVTEVTQPYSASGRLCQDTVPNTASVGVRQ